MNYRQFVEQVKDAAQAGAMGLRGSRDLTPFLHLEAEGSRVAVFPIDPNYFAQPTAPRLVASAVVLIDDYRADKVAWTFTGRSVTEDGSEDILCALVLDREREEMWTAPIIRGTNDFDRPFLGGWTMEPANVGYGFLVTPIQEALRR